MTVCVHPPNKKTSKSDNNVLDFIEGMYENKNKIKKGKENNKTDLCNTGFTYME